ncbi:MAG: sugar phosphate isomerase/epimerase family protein [Planctomycetota bacterium]|jgi:sugar phosphate isomerase/epimerase
MTDRRIAACSWSLGAAGTDDLLRRLQDLDLDAVQLGLSPILQSPDDWADAPARLAACGIRVVSGMMAMAGEDYSTLQSIARTGGVRPDATWDDNRAHAAAVATIAAAAGLDLVTFHAGFLPEDHADPERAVLLDRLRTVADLFEARGVRLGLETGQETAATLVESLHDLGRPNVGVNFDPANMILYGKGDPVEALAQLAPFVMQIHVKDARPAAAAGEWGTEMPAGEGAVDWEAFFRIARAIDPPVDFVIEREAGDDRTGDIRTAIQLIARHLAQPRVASGG